jgi:hypothetical protein
VGDFDRRTQKTAPVGRKQICGVDWLGTYEQRNATGTISPKAIPTAWRQDTKSFFGCVIGELVSRFWAGRYGSAGATWRLLWPGLAIRCASYEWNRGTSFFLCDERKLGARSPEHSTDNAQGELHKTESHDWSLLRQPLDRDVHH